MNNKLQDGPPDFIIRGGRMRTPAKPRASIAALSWAAERANQSYGQFTLRLTAEDEVRVQLEFEEWQRQRALEQARRAAAREAAAREAGESTAEGEEESTCGTL